MGRSILTLKNITKIYNNGILANKDINLDIKKGEIHAVVGENGAGKSTLMKIVFGLEQPSSGDIYVNGDKTVIQNVNHAISLGIGMVHQHFMLIPSFTVTQNVMLGMEPKKGFSIDYTTANDRVREFSQKYKFQVNPSDKIQDITVGLKQKVEIIKALIRGAKLLILDEPTAVLTPQETKVLFEQLKLLKEEGHTIIFISHKLQEVMEISDRITVMRKGETKYVCNTKDTSIKEISNLIVGRDVELSYVKTPIEQGDTVLSVRNLSIEKQEGIIGLHNISFSVKRGMIFGIAGVEGNGQNELVRILTRQMTQFKGMAQLKGKPINQMGIGDMRGNGFSYIPEDRMHMGIAGSASISDNYISNRYEDRSLYKGIFYNSKKIAEETDTIIDEYQVVCRNRKQVIEHLSGGNIQKVVVGRECSACPDVIIAEQPTRGVDLGAAEIIHKKLLSLRDSGAGILLISAVISEVLEVSDVLAVMYNGEIAAFIEEPAKLTETELGNYMLGVKRQTEDEIRRAYSE